MSLVMRASDAADFIASAQDGKRLVRALRRDLDEAERKGWDSLARYKFQMFGYWAAIWVHLNRVGQFNQPNPWSPLVRDAKLHARVVLRSAPADGERA